MSLIASALAAVTLEEGVGRPLRGTWVTNVASTALRSEKDVKEAIRVCQDNKINTVFVVVWNKGLTMYPSAVLERYIGIRQDPLYQGFDPLACIVKEGHKAGMEVHAWFEFGFSYKNGPAESPWDVKHPHWKGREAGSRSLEKNGFYWWNALHPRPQQFLKELITEVVKTYPVDGIQGDDRLPAMPSEGGYDPFTAELYRRDTGKEPPKDHLDPDWVQWRADKLSDFGRSLYKTVKEARPDCQVSWSPSIYPWSKENYLQDWVKWLDDGYADFVIPQVYRYDYSSYEAEMIKLKSQVKPEHRGRVFPGVLTSLGAGYRIDASLLEKKLKLNRSLGFMGECFFYFEGLRGPRSHSAPPLSHASPEKRHHPGQQGSTKGG